MSTIIAGDYVEVKATGIAGEVLCHRGKKLLVSLHEFGEDMKEVLYSENELKRIDIDPLTEEQIRAVIRGELPVLERTRGMDIYLYEDETADYSSKILLDFCIIAGTPYSRLFADESASPGHIPGDSGERF